MRGPPWRRVLACGGTGAADLHEMLVFREVEIGIAPDEKGQLRRHQTDRGVFALIPALADDLPAGIVDGQRHARGLDAPGSTMRMASACLSYPSGSSGTAVIGPPPEPGDEVFDRGRTGAADFAPTAQIALEFVGTAEMGVEQGIVAGGGQDRIAVNGDVGDRRIGHGLEFEQPAQEGGERGREAIAPARVPSGGGPAPERRVPMRPGPGFGSGIGIGHGASPGSSRKNDRPVPGLAGTGRGRGIATGIGGDQLAAAAVSRSRPAAASSSGPDSTMWPARLAAWAYTEIGWRPSNQRSRSMPRPKGPWEGLELREPHAAEFRASHAEIGQTSENVAVVGVGMGHEPGSGAARVEEPDHRRKVAIGASSVGKQRLAQFGSDEFHDGFLQVG